MADADVVITGTVLTVDDARPTAEALAVADSRIIAVGSSSDVTGFVGPNTETVDLGDGCVMPGLPEPTLAWLDEIAPDSPLVIIHNSGHKASVPPEQIADLEVGATYLAGRQVCPQ
jgi:predicted amidohydrolase YtcJ